MAVRRQLTAVLYMSNPTENLICPEAPSKIAKHKANWMKRREALYILKKTAYLI